MLEAVPLVNPGGLAQSESSARGRHKLPQTGGCGGRKGSGSPAAFDLAQPSEIFGHAFLAERFAGHLQIATRTAQSGFHRGATTRPLIVVNELLNQRVDGDLEIERVLGLFQRGQLRVGNFLFVFGQNQLAKWIERRRFESLQPKTDLNLLGRLSLCQFNGFGFRIRRALRQDRRDVLLRSRLD